jgi:hypothetical protein
MAYTFTEKKRIRKSFAKRASVLKVPFLLETQLASYRAFLQADTAGESRKNEGLQAAFTSIFPISSHSGNARLEFVSFSLLPPENVRVRFFVPQAVLPTVHIGDAVTVRCDGCASDLVARVRFISAQAEFTPPVIYSQEERARLVFRVEAIPERPRDLRVGQPVTVALQTAVGVSHASK